MDWMWTWWPFTLIGCILIKYRDMAGSLARWSVVVLCFSLSTSRSLFSIAGLLVLLGLLLEGKWQEKWVSLKLNRPAFISVVLVMWIYLTSIWTQANETTFDYSINVHWKLLLIPAMVLLINDERWKRRCWSSFGLGVALLLLHVYALGFTSIPWSTSGMPDSVFFNALPQSVGLAIFSAFCLSKLIESSDATRKWVTGLAFVAASYAVLSVSQQRLGYLMWATGCLLVLFLQLKPAFRKWGLMISLGLFLTIFLSNEKMQDRFGLAVKEVQAYHFENNYTSIGARMHMWYTSIRSINRAPILGHGIGSYPLVAEAYFQDAEMCAIGCRHPHNQYLFYAVEFGFIGLSLFLLMLYQALSAHRQLKPESTMPLVVLVVFVLSGLVETTLWYRGFVYLFVPLLALAMLAPTQPSNSARV
jgi:O-antigen ligase